VYRLASPLLLLLLLLCVCASPVRCYTLLLSPDDNAYFLTMDRIRKLYNLPTDAFDGEGEAIALGSYEQFEIGAVEEYALANGLIAEGESLSNIVERFLNDPDSVGGSSNPDATHVDLEVSSSYIYKQHACSRPFLVL
jgi:hypothetical protein